MRLNLLEMNKDLHDREFWVAKEEEIKQGKTTDVYFTYTKDILKAVSKNPRVVIEVFARKVEKNWGVVTGIYEAAKLLEGMNVNVKAMEEGEIFLTSDQSIYEPVMQIEADYADISIYENPVLGFLCFSSGISTKAARIRLAAGDKPIFSFGTRRSHPSLAPTIERAAYIAGFDNMSNSLAASLMGIEPVGTMPHALMLCFGNIEDAWKAFDKFASSNVPRIALVDTFLDEKEESITALKVFKGRLYGVRLDTAMGRRHDRNKIIREVRSELDKGDGKDVKIFVSGGLDENEISELRRVVDGFGVGTSVSSARSVDFSFKIVEVIEDGKGIPRAKKDDIAGRKYVYRNEQKFQDVVTLSKDRVPEGFKPLLTDLMVNGKIVGGFKSVNEIRASAVEKIRRIAETKTKPSLQWI